MGEQDPLEPRRKFEISKLVCRFYASTGFCAEGTSCYLPHVTASGREPDNVCRFYFRRRCHFGRKCLYDHVYWKKGDGYLYLHKSQLAERQQRAAAIRSLASIREEPGAMTSGMPLPPPPSNASCSRNDSEMFSNAVGNKRTAGSDIRPEEDDNDGNKLKSENENNRASMIDDHDAAATGFGFMVEEPADVGVGEEYEEDSSDSVM